MKNVVEKKTAYTLIRILTPVQLLFWLQAVEPFLYTGGNEYTSGIILLAIFSVVAILFLRIYFKTGSANSKKILHLWMLLLVVNIAVGFVNDNYNHKTARFTEKESKSLRNYIAGEASLPTSMVILESNDKYEVIGKKYKRINDLNGHGNEFLHDSLMHKIDFYNYLTRSDLGRKYEMNIVLPSDFQTYKDLIDEEEGRIQIEPDGTIYEASKIRSLKDSFYGRKYDFLYYDEVMDDYYSWKYPDYILFIHIKQEYCTCSNLPSEIKLEACYQEYYEKNERIKMSPILFDMLDGQYWYRYSYFMRLFFPEYARTDLANDPYFLIYQGKYKQAREGLKDLPLARREFCEKKLEKLGY